MLQLAIYYITAWLVLTWFTTSSFLDTESKVPLILYSVQLFAMLGYLGVFSARLWLLYFRINWSGAIRDSEWKRV